MTRPQRLLPLLLIVAAVPFLGGAEGGCGKGPVSSRTPAPDVSGAWDIAYDDTLGVEVTIGGAVYTTEIGPAGGTITIDHEGLPIEFDLDCSRPEVVCPSEAWPATVTAEMPNPTYPHRMWVTIPRQSCVGGLVDADPAECGPDTNNPDCDQVCTGEVVTSDRRTFGVINEPGDHFDLFLGAGVATNGINCALLGVSAANADLVTSGSAETDDWRVEEMTNGEIAVAYAGGCLWLGDPDMDAELEALVIGAGIKFTTGFTGSRAP
jgi:hypothetical protein